MQAVLHLAWAVLKVLAIIGIGVACFAAILLIGVDNYFNGFGVCALLGMGMLAAWQAGLRTTLLVLGASPVLLIRLFPLAIVAIIIVPIIVFAMAILAPLFLLQFCIYRALE